MKKIKMLFVMLIVTIASTQVSEAQIKKPSGVVSINGQETDENEEIYYAPAQEYVNFLCDLDPQLPTEIKKWNGAVIDNTRKTYDRNHYQQNAKKLQGDARAYVAEQLKVADQNEGNKLFSSYKPQDNRNYLSYHVSIKNLQFKEDTVYLMGEKGDFSGISWILHDSNNNADGLYYVLTTNSGKMYILARVSCWNNVTINETMWLQTGKAEIVKGVIPAPKKPKPSESEGLNGGDDNRILSVVDTSENGIKVFNFYVNSAGGQGGSVTIGDIIAKGGSSNNNNSNTGGSGRDGKDGKDGMKMYAPPANQSLTPAPAGNGWTHQDRYSVTPDGLYIDRNFQYFNSLPSQSLAMNNPWWGGNGYALFMNQGQQYMVPGNWNNGIFNANWNNCYRWGNGGWQVAVGVGGAGFFANANFFGGYNCAGGQPSWIPPTNTGWGCNRIPQNTCYNRYTPPPVFGQPNMGWTIPAGNQNPGGSGRPGGPAMGYTIRQ